MADSVKNQIPLSRIQKLTADRMLESKRTKPCFYIELKADVTELLGIRPRLKRTLGVKITIDAFYIRALGAAGQRYPLMVGRLEGENITIAESVNCGFAVNAPQGLVVPVIKQAEKKTLAEIATLAEALTDKARANKLTLEEMHGQTIALSNLGVYGVDSFVGIVPPPTSAILAVGNIIPTVVSDNGRLKVKRMVSLTLAADGRVINAGYAAEFLNLVKVQLQNPERLL